MNLKKARIICLSLILFFAIPVFMITKLCITLPDSVWLPQGNQTSIKLARFISCNSVIKTNTSPVSSGNVPMVNASKGAITLQSQNTGNYHFELKLFGIFPIKTMKVDVAPQTKVIPCGNVIGIKMHTDGLLVVGISFTDTNSGKKTPAKDAGLIQGDRILAFNSIQLKNAEHLSNLLKENKDKPVNLLIARQDETKEILIKPSLTNSGTYKIGAWVRDSSSGLGTLTFYNPDTRVFAALGHGIADADTSQLLSISKGKIVNCEITSIRRGENGNPGELKGKFLNRDIGTISENSPCGIYGKYLESAFENIKKEPIATASRFEAEVGGAKILCDVDGLGPKDYDIEIQKVILSSNDGKGMVIKVTDPNLLEKTGGIVQGMSGSPVIQNGKLIGAITHVFVNDSTRGYAVFIELMLDKASGL